MAIYRYPCIFTPSENGWTAEFPDWESFTGVTCGHTWQHARYMAKDLLNIMCLVTEEDGRPFPDATKSIVTSGIVRMIEADTEWYRHEIEQAHRVGRFRMAERARERYVYHKGAQCPEEEGEEEYLY